jgi:uncharacterized repeat protein (TIGR03803 family)
VLFLFTAHRPRNILADAALLLSAMRNSDPEDVVMRAFHRAWSGIALVFFVIFTQSTRGQPSFEVVHGFTAFSPWPGSLIEAADGSFYGTTSYGGPRFDGVVFRLGAIESEPSFLRGDGTVDISDAIATLGFLFLDEERFGCDDACDTNDDGTLDLSDPMTTLGFLFLSDGTIAFPGPSVCGFDVTPDDPGCEAYAECPQ